jgi:hypothetical protein
MLSLRKSKICSIPMKNLAARIQFRSVPLAVDLTSGRCVMMNTKHKMMGKNASKDERAGQRAA